MDDLIKVVTGPIKKVALLLFQLDLGFATVGELMVTGLVFVLLLSIITHSNAVGNIGKIAGKIKEKVSNKNDR